MPLNFHKLRIAERREETADAVSLAFEVPAELASRFAFRPGQYVTLRAMVGGAEVRRPYSICAGLGERLRVGIRLVPGGRFSGHAAGLRDGDTVEVMPPQGTFGAMPAAGAARSYLGVAAGSGITPVLSILKSVLAAEAGSRFVLLYGSRSTAGIMFRGELEDLKDRYLGRLAVVHVLSREAQDIAALSGRLDGARVRALLPGLVDRVDEAFLCGPAGMLEELPPVLAALGVARVQVERFTPAPGGVAAPVAAGEAPAAVATVIHAGATHEVGVAEGETVLDAALRAGLDLPWSCHGGMCSTCRARVVDGSVRMAVNFSLEQWEVEAGYALTCQSQPTSARVVVDYDQV